jgi:hypothetical protein
VSLRGLNAEEYLLNYLPDLEKKTYKEKLAGLLEGKIIYSDSFSRSMRDLGQDAYEIIWDLEVLQKTWAKEHGIQYRSDNWQFEILCAQIRHLKPDVVYFQGTEAAIPGRFENTSRSRTLVTLLKERFSFIRLIAMFSGYPTSVNRTADVDILFSCTPSIQQYYGRLGMSSVLCYHAFDDSVLHKLKQASELHGFTFSGTSRVPESRYWILRELLDRTSISMWIDEEEHLRQKEIGSKGNKTVRRECRRFALKSLRFIFRVLGTRSVEFFLKASWVPNVVHSVAKNFQSEKDLSGRYNAKLVAKATPDIPVDLLREIHSSRCRSPVSGLEYYQSIRSSKISFNRHADASGDSVGNIRMFEVTGTGTCLLTDTGANMKELFEPGAEVVVYTSVDEAVDKVRYLLENDKERENIAQAGHRRTLRDHTFANRCQLIDEIIRAKL